MRNNNFYMGDHLYAQFNDDGSIVLRNGHLADTKCSDKIEISMEVFRYLANFYKTFHLTKESVENSD